MYSLKNSYDIFSIWDWQRRIQVKHLCWFIWYISHIHWNMFYLIYFTYSLKHSLFEIFNETCSIWDIHWNIFNEICFSQNILYSKCLILITKCFAKTNHFWCNLMSHQVKCESDIFLNRTHRFIWLKLHILALMRVVYSCIYIDQNCILLYWSNLCVLELHTPALIKLAYSMMFKVVYLQHRSKLHTRVLVKLVYFWVAYLQHRSKLHTPWCSNWKYYDRRERILQYFLGHINSC